MITGHDFDVGGVTLGVDASGNNDLADRAVCDLVETVDRPLAVSRSRRDHRHQCECDCWGLARAMGVFRRMPRDLLNRPEPAEYTTCQQPAAFRVDCRDPWTGEVTRKLLCRDCIQPWSWNNPYQPPSSGNFMVRLRTDFCRCACRGCRNRSPWAIVRVDP